MTSRDWVQEGTALCRRALANLDGPSRLPGWSRRHVAAHLSLNAEGLGNLVEWARTGAERPMYPSAEARNADIESNARRDPADLRTWFDASAEVLDAAMDELTEERWRATVRTAQGREIPATYIPWLRAREVMIHAVDLDAGLSFADLPEAFLENLCQDVRTMRGNLPDLQGALPEIAAYLVGRPHTDVTANGRPAEPLPPWL